ncbi:hypothetical protein [Streptomyces sp. SCL15-4]|nr:hypothetical protein [Streptomyces sp. SCL15-4]
MALSRRTPVSGAAAGAGLGDLLTLMRAANDSGSIALNHIDLH